MNIKDTQIQLYESTYGGNFPLANYFLMEYSALPKVLEFKDCFSEQLVEKLKSIKFLDLIHEHNTHSFSGKNIRYSKVELVFQSNELEPYTHNRKRYILHISHHNEEDPCRALLLYRDKSDIEPLIKILEKFVTDKKLKEIGLIVKDEFGLTLKDFELTDFGRATAIESSKNFTTIIDGRGNQEEVSEAIEGLKQMLKDSGSTYEAKKIQERISRLASGVAVINVGGSTDIEMGERKDRIEDALNAVRSAQLGGVVPGGGTALLMASDALEGLEAGNVDEQLGFDIVKKAIEAPFRQMAENAGYSADLKLQKIKKSSEPMVCDFRTGDVVVSSGSGIIDPVKVTRSALTNAASAASTLIMADYAIILQN